jgi:hypothetical protein
MPNNNFNSNQPNNQSNSFGQPSFAQPIAPQYNPMPTQEFQPLKPTLSQSIPGAAKVNREPFNYKKYLAYFLVTSYIIFSLIWLGVLYFAPDGTKICRDTTCYINLPKTKQVEYLQSEYKTQSEKLKLQSNAKNELNQIIQSDLTFNDKINEALIKLFKAHENYELYIGRNVRFINNKAEFSETFTQKELDDRLLEIKTSKSNIEQLISQNYSDKETIKSKITEIYNLVGETPNNKYLE